MVRTRSLCRTAGNATTSQERKTKVPRLDQDGGTESKTTTKGSDALCVLDGNDLIEGTLVCRPSKRNKSPYVGDLWVKGEEREAIVHLPNLDMGGKCRKGVRLLCRPARDRSGKLVGKDAVNPKYGTPKCEFIAQLVYVDEQEWHPTFYPPTWVGAHPSLGESIARQWLERGVIYTDLVKIESQVTNPFGANKCRFDFLCTHKDGTQRLVEVKTVVDTDYSSVAPPQGLKCSFLSDETPYTRTAIFPWGNSNQKGPDGEPVVSSRAIHHVKELTRVPVPATVLFVVIRGDAVRFRPNSEACPSFVKYLKQASDNGVDVIARKVWWSEDSMGGCHDGGPVPVEWPC